MTRWFVIVSFAVTAAGFSFLAFANSAPQQPATTGTLQPPVATPQPAEALDGTWELVSLIEDGKLVPIDVVKQTMIKDARVIVKGPTAAFIRPDGKIRTVAFVTDGKASPKTLDVAGDLRVGGKAIYMRDGDVLMICTRGSDTEARPTVMASLPGSDTFLMTFRRVEAPQVTVPATQLKPPAPVVVPAADKVQKLLVGTWGHQTDEQIVKVTFNTDNTFAMLRTYKKGFKKVFDQEDRLSGHWRLKDGEVTLTIIASTHRENIGQVYSYRITSINDSEMIYVDTISGQRRVEWKLR